MEDIEQRIKKFIAGELGMNESDVSHQLCGLRQMHLVRVRKSGRSSTHLMTITWRAYSPSGSTTFNTDK